MKKEFPAFAGIDCKGEGVRKPRAKKHSSIWVEEDHVRIQQDPAVIQHMRECEAREWIARYQQMVRDVGVGPAQIWWYELKERMKKSRGKPAVDALVILMKQEQHNARKPVQEEHLHASADPIHAAGVQRSSGGREEGNYGLCHACLLYTSDAADE